MDNKSHNIAAGSITELTLQDVPALCDDIKYADGEIFFADNISSLPRLQREFKVNFIAFAFCLAGNLQLRLGEHTHRLETNDGLFIDVNTIVAVQGHSDDFRCFICVMSSNLGFSMISRNLFDAAQLLRNNPVIRFTPDEITLMTKYYELASFKMDHPDLNYGRETMTGIVQGLTYDLLSNIDRHLGTAPSGVMRQGDRLYRRFMFMLADNSSYTRSVKSFADELCVTPKYLSTVCRQHAGKTAGEMISMSVVSRIKQLLLYSNLTIKEVATSMNFTNLSFFGKYVKRHLGHSPNNYRRINNYGQ